jgi:hypothetical protein
MGKPTGFLEIERQDRGYDNPQERLRNWKEFVHPLPAPALNQQAARCMDCGIPFCQQRLSGQQPSFPDFNSLVYREHWQAALENLQSTNNFPEFTGRICPAPCEASCTLNIIDSRGDHQDDRMRHRRPGLGRGLDHAAARRRAGTGKRVAVVGSGPAGLACAQQLAQGRPRGDCLREERPRRRPAPLRHPGLQDGEVASDRPPRRPDAGRGRHLPDQRGDRRQRSRSSDGSVVTTSDVDWSWLAAPSSRATWRFRAASWTASTSPWTSWFSRTARNAGDDEAKAAPNGTLIGPGQACRRHRGRRHRLRLRRHLQPPRRPVR